MAPDTVEFALGWKRSLATLLIVLPMPVMWMILFPLMMPDTYEIRWSGAILLSMATVVVLAYQSRARTVLTREGISAREVGRPWRMLGRTMIPWREVQAIDARKLGVVYQPVVHVTGGRAVRLRVPVERSYAKLADDLATIQRWQIENTGADPEKIVVPARLQVPGVRRRLLFPLAAIVVTVLGVVGMVAAFAMEWDEPPEVLACPLVPPGLAQRIMPGAPAPEPLGKGEPGDSCQWLRRAREGKTDGGSLIVGVTSRSDGFNRSTYKEDRAKDLAKHVIHPIAGTTGHTWSLVNSGSINAEAHAVTGGYRLRLTLQSRGAGLSQTTAEQQLAEVVHAVIAKLDGARS